jgi:hypothetical protein
VSYYNNRGTLLGVDLSLPVVCPIRNIKYRYFAITIDILLGKQIPILIQPKYWMVCELKVEDLVFKKVSQGSTDSRSCLPSTSGQAHLLKPRPGLAIPHDVPCQYPPVNFPETPASGIG